MAATTHHRNTTANPTRRSVWPDPRQNSESTQRDPRPLSEAERKADAARTARVLKLSSNRIGAALAIECVEHGAEPGSYCFPAARGLCRPRYEVGALAAAANDAAHPQRGPHAHPDGLAQLASAVRNAAHDARWRERNAVRATGVER